MPTICFVFVLIALFGFWQDPEEIPRQAPLVATLLLVAIDLAVYLLVRGVQWRMRQVSPRKRPWSGGTL